MAPSLTVRVPASTSNLGPGFDFLGLALGLHLEVRATGIAGERHELARRGAGVEELPEARDDLVLKSFEQVRAAHGFRGHCRFEVSSEIPIGRGLGSSGAAIVAGALLARGIAGHDIGDAELLRLGIELEGHPDNVAAALHGGLTLCARRADGSWRVLQPALAPSLAFAVAWPKDGLPTARARAALPPAVPFADATENPRRLALLLEGLRTGERELVELGGEDRLHVPYRLPLLPGTEQAFAAARAAGAWLVTLSGAGSGLVAIGPHGPMDAVARAMAEALRAATGRGVGRVLAPELRRPELRRD